MSVHANLERRRQAIYGWLLLSPAAVLLTVFAFYPSIATLWSSLFSRNTRRRPTEFVGTENYSDLFADPTFWLVVKNNRRIQAIVATDDKYFILERLSTPLRVFSTRVFFAVDC